MSIKFFYKSLAIKNGNHNEFMSELVILRGNFSSGKTSVAKDLQQLFGPNTMLISQDAICRDMLKVKDKESIVPEIFDVIKIK